MKIRSLVLAMVFVLALTYSLHLIRSNTSTAPDYATRVIGVNEPEVVVDIASGATGYEVAELLFKNKVTKSVSAYFRVAVVDKNSEKVSPGSHRLTLSISAAQALEQLLDPKRIPNLIKVFEGAWSQEIVDSLVVYGFKKVEVLQALNSLSLPSGFSNPEGLLFPAQYSFPKQTSALQVLQTMVDRFRSEKFGQDILNGSGSYTPLQLLTIASIVQAEGDTKDFSKVARVIFNRLKISMPLQMDSTVHYIKKVRGEIFLSTSSTLIDSPYNTYKRYGLPPTPIGNPGVRAMEAVNRVSPGATVMK